MRFSESEKHNPTQLDFVPRERRRQIWQMILAFSIGIGAIFVIGFITGRASNALSMFASMAIVSILCFYAVFRKQQSLDLVMATEYQNMLFAQAAAIGSSFCIFVKSDGTIVYANDGVRKLFASTRPFSESQALSALFEQGGVRKIDRERIMTTIHNSESDRLVFPLSTAEGTVDYILTVEPLKRPGGYLLIRGREYKDTRTGVQLLPDLLRSTSAEKLDQLLSNTPVPLYITDAFGRFEYVNPAFEQLLGYNPGEIIDGKLALYHVLYQLGGQQVSEDYTLGIHKGEALLQKKQGSLANVLLHQSPLRDDDNKLLGVTGSALPLGTSVN